VKAAPPGSGSRRIVSRRSSADGAPALQDGAYPVVACPACAAQCYIPLSTSSSSVRPPELPSAECPHIQNGGGGGGSGAGVGSGVKAAARHAGKQ